MSVPRGQELITIPPEQMSSQERNRKGPTEQGLRLLNPRGEEEEDTVERFAAKPRQKYAAMAAHKERAAQALAVGSTQKMAANYAGVSQRQIKKYYTDPEFRTRIQELREVLGGKIQGMILREFNRRLTGKEIRGMEIIDLTRVFDRVTAGGKGMAITVQGDVNVNRYEAILTQLFSPNTGSEGEDFPVYGAEEFSVSEDDSPE